MDKTALEALLAHLGMRLGGVITNAGTRKVPKWIFKKE